MPGKPFDKNKKIYGSPYEEYRASENNAAFQVKVFLEEKRYFIIF